MQIACIEYFKQIFSPHTFNFQTFFVNVSVFHLFRSLINFLNAMRVQKVTKSFRYNISFIICTARNYIFLGMISWICLIPWNWCWCSNPFFHSYLLESVTITAQTTSLQSFPEFECCAVIHFWQGWREKWQLSLWIDTVNLKTNGNKAAFTL